MNIKQGKELITIWISKSDRKTIKEELEKKRTNWGIISQILIKWSKEGLLEFR